MSQNEKLAIMTFSQLWRFDKQIKVTTKSLTQVDVAHLTLERLEVFVY
jgi:hypothetical protein